MNVVRQKFVPTRRAESEYQPGCLILDSTSESSPGSRSVYETEPQIPWLDCPNMALNHAETTYGYPCIDPLPRLKPVGFRTQAETAGKACLTSPTPTDKTLPVFAIENRDDRNRIFTSRESIVQSYHAGRAKNDSVAEAATREPLLHPTAKVRWALRVPQPSLSCKQFYFLSRR